MRVFISLLCFLLLTGCAIAPITQCDGKFTSANPDFQSSDKPVLRSDIRIEKGPLQ